MISGGINIVSVSILVVKYSNSIYYTGSINSGITSSVRVNIGSINSDTVFI